jgi:membrane protease YdiL (CAAX protease family)
MALPVLQWSVGAFRASIVIGVIWAVWHVPLFLMAGSTQAGAPLWLYAPAVVGISVIATWLYNAAGGRVLVPVVFHTLSNAVSVTTARGRLAGRPAGRLGGLAVFVWRYETDRLASKPLPDGGLDFAAFDESRSSGTYRSDALGNEQA